MPVIYDGKMIIPGPLFDIRREVNRNESGRKTRQVYSITARGRVLAWKGSPNSSGVFWTGSYNPGPPDEQIADSSRLAAIRAKMQALNDLFCSQGMWLEIQPFDGSQSIKFQPRIRNISFANGKWYDFIEYSIEMEADTIFFGGQEACGLLSDVVPDETWSIEAGDQIGRTYRLTHNISSQQKGLYDATGAIPDGNEGWQRARDVVLPYLGMKNSTAMLAPGVLSLGNTWDAFNYVRGQQIDKASGKFGITETWLVYDPTGLPPALDDFTIQSRIANDSITHVSIEGTITGLEVRDKITGVLSQTRWQSAIMYFNTVIFPNVFNRASSYSGLILNPVQIMSTIGRNPIQGTITYSAEYSTRRLPMIPGAINEDISAQMEGGTDVFASIPVPGRPWGPVLQGIETISERTYTIGINAQFNAANIVTPINLRPDTDGLILSLAPIALQVFRQRDTINWSPETGKYSRNITFVYQ